MNFEVSATVKRCDKRKPEEVTMFIEAEDRSDALFQANHGVIEAAAEKTFPGSTVKYDLRRLRKQST
jgi:hypothetical protein